jgi:hypothetical protein
MRAVTMRMSRRSDMSGIVTVTQGHESWVLALAVAGRSASGRLGAVAGRERGGKGESGTGCSYWRASRTVEAAPLREFGDW